MDSVSKTEAPVYFEQVVISQFFPLTKPKKDALNDSFFCNELAF